MNDNNTSNFKIALLVLTIVNGFFIVFYARTILHPELFYPDIFWDDHWTLFVPYQLFYDASIHSGTFPFWSPYSFTGQPFSGNPGPMAYYPPNMLRSLLNFNPTSLSVYYSLAALYLFHFNLLGIGMFIFSRRLGLNISASIVALLATYSFATCISSAYLHNVFLWVVAWMPWIFYCLFRAHHATARIVRLRWAVGTGILYAAQLLTPVPQIVVVSTVVYVAFAYALVWIYPVESDSSKTKLFLNTTLTVALFGGTGALCASAMLLPTMEFAQFSARGATKFGAPNGTSLLLDTLRAVEKAHLSTLSIIRNLGFIFTMIVSCSISFMVLLYGVLLRPISKSIWLMGAMTYVVFDCSMGSPFPIATMVGALAPFKFSLSSYSANLMPVPMGILIALGYNALCTIPPKRTRHRNNLIWIPIVGILVIFLLAHNSLTKLITTDSVSAIRMIPADPRLMIVPMLAFLTLAFRARLNPKTIATLIVLLGITEAGIRTQNYTSNPSPRNSFELLAHNHMTLEPTNRRIMGDNLPNHHILRSEESVLGYDPLQISNVTRLIKNPGEQDKYERALTALAISKNKFISLFPKRKFWLSPSVVYGPLPETNTLFPPTSVVFMADKHTLRVNEVKPEDVPRSAVNTDPQRMDISNPRMWKTQHQTATDDVVAISSRAFKTSLLHKSVRARFTSDSPLSVRMQVFEFVDNQRAETYLVGPISVVDENGNSIDLEWSLPDYEHLKIIFWIENEALGTPFKLEQAEILIDSSDEGNQIEITKFTANRVELNISDLEGPRMLTFSSPRYPGWEAFVDGEPVELYTANDVFMAIEVQQGSHQVEFRFAPRVAYAGIGVSLITLSGATVFLLWGFRMRRRRGPDSPSASEPTN